jgi:hypothetical protein
MGIQRHIDATLPIGYHPLMTDSRRGPLLDHLDTLEARCEKGDLSLQDILDAFGVDGHYVLIAFLIIPFLQPLPLVGLSTPFGLFIGIIAVMAYLKRPPSLPKRLAKITVSATIVKRIATTSETVFEKISIFSHPRWTLFFRGGFRELNTLLLILNVVLLALPLPIPFSNAIPAWMIAVHTIGQLEEDGLLIALSYLLTVFCFGYFAVLAKGAWAIFQVF